jgi:hypothetical protein
LALGREENRGRRNEARRPRAAPDSLGVDAAARDIVFLG